MVKDLKNKLRLQLNSIRNDPMHGFPEFARKSGKSFLSNFSYVIFSDPFDYMAAECFHVLQGQEVIGVCADKLPAGCENQNLLTAIDLQRLVQTNKNLVAIMCTDDPTYDLGLTKLAMYLGLPMIPHHLIIRAANATTDLRNSDWLTTILDKEAEYFDFIDLLADEFSKISALRVLLSQVTGNHSYRRAIERPYHTLYFNTGLFSVGSDEVFVDCGASQGESITNLLRETGMNLKYSYEVEPDKFNVMKLQKLKHSLSRFGLKEKIEVVPVAVGDCDAVVPFNHVGTHSGAISENATGSVTLTTIDKITNGNATLIKMDLEGYERPALAGAAETLKQSKPRLAISAYHRPDDLIELTRLVRGFRNDYRVGVQHHTFHRWDTCLYFY